MTLYEASKCMTLLIKFNPTKRVDTFYQGFNILMIGINSLVEKISKSVDSLGQGIRF